MNNYTNKINKNFQTSCIITCIRSMPLSPRFSMFPDFIQISYAPIFGCCGSVPYSNEIEYNIQCNIVINTK